MKQSRIEIYFVKNIAGLLLAMASMYAMSLCMGKFYEPVMPEELKKGN